MSHLASAFSVDRTRFNMVRGLGLAAVMLVPLVVLTVLHQEKYWLSVAFGALFVGLSDPGGEYGKRAARMGLFAVFGALLTVFGFATGADGWGGIVLAVFAVTLLAGSVISLGMHRVVAGLLLNCWFLIVLAAAAGNPLASTLSSAAWQALAWLVGSALAIGYTFALWIARGRTPQPQPLADLLPGDTTPVPLTKEILFFVVIRAAAVAIAAWIAFGLHLPNADWMPVSALVAMRPTLQQSAQVAEQRLFGAIIGAVVAAALVTLIGNQVALEVIIVVLAAVAGALRAASYTWYCAAVAALVLIALDLPHPSGFTVEGERILFTFAGVGIAVVVMFLASRLRARRPETTQDRSPLAGP